MPPEPPLLQLPIHPRPPNSINPKTHLHIDATKTKTSPPESPINPLSSALSAAQAKYTLSNPTSLSLHNSSLHHFPGGNTRTVIYSSPFPITWEKGEGCKLTSVDGDTYVDFLGEYTAGIFGHSNEAIRDAVEGALRKGWNLGGSGVYEKELGRKIINRFSQSGLEYVRFTNSGTEANTMAIATALAFTGRKTILVFTNSYHGSTLSFPTSNPNRQPATNLPHNFIIAPYNSIPSTLTLLHSLPPSTLAAILVEGVLGSGGAIPASLEFLQFLNSTATRLGALFIMDEVMTSRLSYHGYSASLGLRPDLLTLGKWVGGGMSFGAFGGRKDVMALYDPRTGGLSHSGTFNNNVVSMAAGVVGLDVLTEEKIAMLNSMGEKLKKGVEGVLRKYHVLGADTAANENDASKSRGIDEKIASNEKKIPSRSHEKQGNSGSPKMSITGIGSMLCIHFNEPPLAPAESKTLLGLFHLHMLEENIYLAPRGFIALSIEIGEREVEMFVRAVEGFVGRFRAVLCG